MHAKPAPRNIVLHYEVINAQQDLQVQLSECLIRLTRSLVPTLRSSGWF
jgi:hypothetical protein